MDNVLLHSKHTQTDDLSDLQLGQAYHTKELELGEKTDLGDIELTETIKASRVSRESRAKQKMNEDEEEAFIFEDLPDDPSETSNPFKKFGNWARQLF